MAIGSMTILAAACVYCYAVFIPQFLCLLTIYRGDRPWIRISESGFEFSSPSLDAPVFYSWRDVEDVPTEKPFLKSFRLRFTSMFEPNMDATTIYLRLKSPPAGASRRVAHVWGAFFPPLGRPTVSGSLACFPARYLDATPDAIMCAARAALLQYRDRQSAGR